MSYNTRVYIFWSIVFIVFIAAVLGTYRYVSECLDMSCLDTSVHIDTLPTTLQELGAREVSWRLVAEKRERISPHRLTEVLCLWKVEMETLKKQNRKGQKNTPRENAIVYINFALFDEKGFMIASDEQHAERLPVEGKSTMYGKFWLGTKSAALAHHASVRVIFSSKKPGTRAENRANVD